MATETVPAEAIDAVGVQTNELFNVLALLMATESRLCDAGAETDDELHLTLRLVQMAADKVRAATDVFFAIPPTKQHTGAAA